MLAKICKTNHMKTIRNLILLIAGLNLLNCENSPSTMPNPLIRVDLTHKMPKKKKILLPSAIDLDCLKKINLCDNNQCQNFVINWRVADFEKERYFVAVDVAAAGEKNIGEASASIVETKEANTIQVSINWSYHRGCQSGEKSFSTMITLNDVSCKKPADRGLLKKKAATQPSTQPTAK